MNLDQLQKKLLAAARAHAPTERVPLAFEKRIRAHLTAKPAVDLALLWSRALWRATVPCLALTLVLAGVSMFPSNQITAPTTAAVTESTMTTDDLATVFEQTLLASSDQLTTYDFLEETW